MNKNKELDDSIITETSIEDIINDIALYESINASKSFRKSGWEDLAQEYACNLRIDKYEHNCFMTE